MIRDKKARLEAIERANTEKEIYRLRISIIIQKANINLNEPEVKYI